MKAGESTTVGPEPVETVPDDGALAETVANEIEADGEVRVSRGRRLTALAVALYLFAQAVIVLINGPAPSSEMLMATIVRLAVLAMIGGMAIRGRVWARWIIGGLSALNVVSVIFGTAGNLGTFSAPVLALTAVVIVALVAAAYLLLLSPRVRG